MIVLPAVALAVDRVPNLIHGMSHTLILESTVMSIRAIAPTTPTSGHKRSTERRSVKLAARLTWKDQRGTPRFVSVVTHDVSEQGVYVECQSIVSIPLYRLVQFQLERESRESDGLPFSLRQGRILSAVYRVTPPAPSGRRQGLALRLMVDPRRRPAAELADARATA